MFEPRAVHALGAAALVAALIACGGDRPTAPRSAAPSGAGGSGDAPAVAVACTPDQDAPTIVSVAANPGTLWPPNHKLVPVTVTTAATDACDPAPRCAISSVSSNEPVNGLGDGDTAPDWFITGAGTILLRAERSGLGTGRVYTIGMTCTDAAGNSSQSATFVTVPHDQGGHS